MSARIRLRVVEFDDAPALAQLAVSQAEHLRLWEPRRAADYATASTQHDLVARSLAAYERGSAVPFLIVTDDDEIIGRVNVTGIVRGALQSCAIGYWVSAVAQVVDFAFTDLSVHRVQAETLPENVGSRNVLERNGFELFGGEVRRRMRCSRRVRQRGALANAVAM
jgi:ribosomal-protein-alanine N-acetyltransferase